MIKGMFVNSHINLLREKKGEDAIVRLESEYGDKLEFNAFADIPIARDKAILRHVLKALKDTTSASVKTEMLNTGSLSFRDFVTTVYGKMILHVLDKDFKAAVLAYPHIAVHIYKNIHFYAQDLGEKAVRITIENSGYDMDHFYGFFTEWMAFWEYTGEVEAVSIREGIYEYTMRWQ